MHLTKREVQVVELVATGATNADVAATLGITIGTVKNNLYNIYNKLGLWSRLELALWVTKETHEHTRTIRNL